MSQSKDNTGAIFINDRKETDNHPDRTGSCVIGGVEYWISGWIKQSEGKPPFLSLAFKQKDQQKGSTNKTKPTAQNMKDDIPFR